MLRLSGVIERGLEETVVLFVSEEITDMPNGVPKVVVAPGGGPLDQGFELGEGRFYGVEIGTVGRQKQKPCTKRTHGICGRGAFVGGLFDRILIAQATFEGLTLVTADRQFAAYEVALR